MLAPFLKKKGRLSLRHCQRREAGEVKALQNIPTQNTRSRNRKRELPGTKDFDLNQSVARATEARSESLLTLR